MENYLLYVEYLNDFSEASILPFRNKINSNHWFYSLVINREKVSKDLHDIISELQTFGIQTRPIWGLVHEQKPYEHNLAYEIERAKYFSERIINIPCSTQITKKDIKYVVDKLKYVLK